MNNKIIQFGEGGFLRGFVDWMLQCTNEKTGLSFEVTVVQPIKTGLCKALLEQGCAYTHVMRGLENGVPTEREKRIEVIKNCIDPYEDYEAYLSLADDKDYRFVVSNTTEAGISYSEGDSLADSPQNSFPAKVCALLYRRFKNKLPGFIFLPCELIDKNGSTLKSIVIRYAREWGLCDEFISFIENDNVFCNTLVDRIVTGYPKNEDHPLKATDKFLDTSELFHLWVIEGYARLFEELPLDKAGLEVILCDDIEPYRTRKVSILNGAHTSMIPYALLLGVETVKECMENKELSEFVKACVYDEIIPTLDLPESELKSYAASVFERFENPFIKHFCASISLNSVSKFKVRVLPSILEYVRRYGKNPEHLLFSFAKLIEFYKKGTPNDGAEVTAFMKENSVAQILASKELWDEDLSFLAKEVEKYVTNA